MIRVFVTSEDHYIEENNYRCKYESFNEIPEEIVKKHPGAFDITLYQNGKAIYEWICEQSTSIFGSSWKEEKLPTIIKESKWKERLIFPNGTASSWMDSTFNGLETIERVFSMELNDEQAKCFQLKFFGLKP